ncbi:MAG TPA: DUF86 domain-containing protein [Tepidisphaeraceae bacterium]|nr:DUF86 domain-containing protein [Tepidisphaeraceae bacterium]
MRSDREKLLDILDAIASIERYASRGRPEFDANELIQTWIVHHIQIIGEASRVLSEPFKQANPQVPWRSIAAMRNVVVHIYFGVDPDEIWSAVENDLPVLKVQVESIVKSLPSP